MAVNFERVYATLRECLEREYRVEDLKPLARMLCDVAPKRKDDLVKAVCAAIGGEGLKKAFAMLHPVQQSAVAEMVHSYCGSFEGGRFSAKYGGTARQSLSDLNKKKESPWSLFLCNGIMPNDLRSRLAEFVPKPKGDELLYLSRYDGLWYFRINPLGAFCLGLSERYDAVAEKPLPCLKGLPLRPATPVPAPRRCGFDSHDG